MTWEHRCHRYMATYLCNERRTEAIHIAIFDVVVYCRVELPPRT